MMGGVLNVEHRLDARPVRSHVCKDAPSGGSLSKGRTPVPRRGRCHASGHRHGRTHHRRHSERFVGDGRPRLLGGVQRLLARPNWAKWGAHRGEMSARLSSMAGRILSTVHHPDNPQKGACQPAGPKVLLAVRCALVSHRPGEGGERRRGNKKGTNSGPPDCTRRTRRITIVLRTPPHVLNGTAVHCGPPFGTKRPQVQILSPRPFSQVADLRECRFLRAVFHSPAIATEASRETNGTPGRPRRAEEHPTAQHDAADHAAQQGPFRTL